MGELQLFVDGMSCRRCVREVTALLRDIAGVETVSADPGDSTVRLTGSMRLEDVRTALTGIDDASHLSHHSEDPTGDAGKSTM